MPTPNSQRLWSIVVPSASEAISSKGQALETVTIDVAHEIGSTLEPSTITETRIVQPSSRPVRVRVQSQVVTDGIRKSKSPEYLASIRRRSARRLATAVTELEPHSNREDFVVCTYPILKQINDLLATLIDGNYEGNSREMLRQVRNTLMNGGWNQYRKTEVRKLVVDILQELANVEEVVPNHVKSGFARLLEAKLNPIGAPLPLDDEDESINGQEEIPD